MDTTIMKLTINRNKDDNFYSLIFEDLDKSEIILSDSTISDVESLFNKIFDWIVANEKIIQFEIDDDNDDLFHEVAEDIKKNLNSEILSAKEDFLKIIELDKVENS